MEEILLLIGLFATFAFFAWFLIKKAREANERIRKAWTQVAEVLGGDYDPAKRTIDAVIEGIEVRLDTYTVTTGQVTISYARTTTKTTSSNKLAISRSGKLSEFAKKLGLQDLTIGDAAYDEAFIIKSDDAQWATQVLVDQIRQEHLKMPSVTIRVQDGKLTTLEAGYAADVDRLVARIRFTAAVAVSVNNQSRA